MFRNQFQEYLVVFIFTVVLSLFSFHIMVYGTNFNLNNYINLTDSIFPKKIDKNTTHRKYGIVYRYDHKTPNVIHTISNIKSKAQTQPTIPMLPLSTIANPSIDTLIKGVIPKYSKYIDIDYNDDDFVTLNIDDVVPAPYDDKETIPEPASEPLIWRETNGCLFITIDGADLPVFNQEGYQVGCFES